MKNPVFAVSLVMGGAAAAVFAAVPVFAHVIAGARVFPVTLTFDDPGVGDEATLPQIVYQPGPGGTKTTQFQWEYDKRITDSTALIYNQGWDILSTPGAKTRTGFENVFVTGKWQAFTNAEHEFVASLGVIREFSGGYATQGIGGDQYGSTAPTLYLGKGLGDLPIGVFRPLAVTGELSYVAADKKLNSAGDNNGTPNSWSGDSPSSYSIPYLQSQVKDFGLPGFVNHLIPIVEAKWSSPASGPAQGQNAQFSVSPGVIYLGDTYQVGLEAIIPGNKAAGPHVGVIAQVHFFFDDLFPNSLGRPLIH